MPYLSCDAANCAHNKNQYCTLDSIDVSGQSAVNATATCCYSFENKPTDATTPDTEQEYVKISCNASNCDYNCSGTCEASDVSVGTTAASTCEETECDTFVCD